jgi:hypothetical protein
MNTSCKYCVFAERSEKQTGCALNRLAKFPNVKLVGDTYIVEGRKCNTLRTKQWADEHSDKTKSELAQLVRKEVELNCDIIIVASKPNVYLEDIERTVRSALLQTLPAKNIRVVLNVDINPLTVYDVANTDNFYVDNIIIRDIDGNRLPRPQVVDIAADKCTTSQCYAVFDAGFKIPETFVHDLDCIINDNLEVFALLQPKDNNGLVVHTALHNMLHGNRPIKLEEYEDGALIGDDIVEKAKWLFTQKENIPHMIRKVEDICKGI